MSRFFIILAALLISAVPLAAADTERVNDFQISSTFSQLPLYFVENQGQIDSRDVAYYVMGADKTLYFTSEGIIFGLARKDGNAEKHGCVKLDFVDANPGVKPRGEEKQKAIFSYFKGTVEDWKTGIATYRRIVYENLWPGIDLVYHGDGSRLKYEFIVKPGADPERIRLTYRGVNRLCVNESGELEVITPDASFKDGKPQAYQVLKGGKRAVSMAYELEKGEADTGTYGFEIGDYDPNEILILDPVLFVSCGYIGGYSNDFARDITVDRLGNVYIAGGTLSKENSFPVKVGPDLTYNDSYDGWVAKVNADGKSLAYCGYIGGKGHDECWSIEVDGTGSIFLVGETMSDETSFPVLGGPDLTINGQRDVFVAKLNPMGTGLVYCGYIGGDLDDHAFGIDVDHEGNAYVAGWTASTDASFPVLVGPDLSFNGAWYNGDAFVAKVQADGASLVYCGYIGGEGRDWGQGIAVDQHGCAYVTGATNSSEVTFPVLVGPDLSHEGNDDAFIAKVKVDGTGLEYCGYIGSTEADVGYAVAVDGLGRAYVTGEATPPCKNFPVVMGPDRTHNGGYRDAFVAKINERGSKFIYCGFIGGDDSDRGRGIAVDGWGNAFVGGVTTSSESTFPVKGGPDLTYNYKADGFVAKVRADGSQLVYCGYIGGKDDDGVSAVAVDVKGIAYVTGTTRSPETTFPVTGGPDLTQNGDLDGYVAKISPALVVDARHLSARMGGVVNFSLYAAEENKSRRYILLGGASGTEPGILLPGGAATLPLNFDYFSSYAFQMLNSPPFANFSNVLGVSGNSWAQMDTTILEPIPPGCIGLKLNFAYALSNPWDFVSNPVWIEIVP